MTSNRFLLQAGDYDLAYEFRVADLTRVDKTKEDFWNEEVEVYEYLEYLNYLYMNGAFLTMEEANKILNGLHKENAELQHKLSQQEMEYATDLHRLAEENEQLRQSYIQLEHRHSLLHDECLDAECDRDSYHKDVLSLEKENEKLRTKNNAYLQDIEVYREENTHLKLENEQLKEEVKGLNDILARYEEKELKEQTDHKEKDCGHCKHLQIDGMFGMWCEKKRNWTEVKYCEDFERDVHGSYLF